MELVVEVMELTDSKTGGERGDDTGFTVEPAGFSGKGDGFPLLEVLSTAAFRRLNASENDLRCVIYVRRARFGVFWHLCVLVSLSLSLSYFSFFSLSSFHFLSSFPSRSLSPSPSFPPLSLPQFMSV